MTQANFQVMLVGNDPHTMAALSGLQKDGLCLTSASTGDEALARLAEQPADMVLIDLESLAKDGFELLRHLEEQPLKTFTLVIALATPSDQAGQLCALELGAAACLNKPFDAIFRARLLGHLQTKRRLDELQRGNAQLSEALRVAESSSRAKSDFLAAMSHEIRTPMNGVIAMVGLLMETSLTGEQRGYLETIQTSGESLLTIINDILDFSKIEAGRLELDPRPFNLRGCIEESLDLLAPRAAEKNLDLVYRMEAGVPALVEGDSLRLRQVLVNLLGNAVKFTPGGDVFLQVKQLSALPDGTGEPSLLHLHFSVRDTGVGIAPDRLVRLFQPFVQADAATAQRYGGTGLGLVISKRLVELMGGKMWAESVPGRGSTFHFTLNVLVQPSAPPAALAGRQEKLANLRLLIVDDNAASRDTLAAQTSQWGMIPKTAENAAQALDWLRAGEMFDLAVLDWQMPEMNGLALAGEIRKLPHAAMMPLVLLAPVGTRADAPAAANVAFAYCINKPVKSASFCEALTSAIRSPKTAAPKTVAAADKDERWLATRLPLRMLVCDDNALNQKVAVRILQQLGYQPDVANDGREALEALDRQPYDLVFMDVMMPEMDGLGTTRAIRERQRGGAPHPSYQGHIFIVAMTAHAMQGDREKCLAAGMDDYLAKPIRPADVRNVIERRAAPASRPAAQPPPAPSAPPPPVEELPVETSRIMDLTGGDEESTRELVELFIKQTTDQLAQIEAAIHEKNTEQLRHVAHSCKGASATLGMAPFAKLLLELEQQGKAGDLTRSRPGYENAVKEFKRIKDFLAAQSAPAATVRT
jgi:signal transduction histidine kinase/two-component SAPR family response regulator/HPt (histidine-containing phosphotransfer) domain-containing protein